ncbi:alanine racemase [Kordiimonas lacus]|uniref:Tat (Twin-arginine translocation) pathway signal sequence n=1 Tax=Kordiimonas lacus TaxID=637679 RepID=A0A1G7CR81_9PROT|nr:alanine racemase [Kordiimonas lacus]SDE41807.1 Tat (twin-arginine translocation) pathway signal sequence [Kordiimonas lacus]
MPNISRRRFLAGSAAVAGAAAIALRPEDRSGPRAAYFLSLQAALIKAGIATPTLVIDRQRLNANIDTLTGHLPDGMGYRIVAKSLPSLKLLDHIMTRAGTARLMTFNLPMLSTLSIQKPKASQLIGKPLPVAAARRYFDTLPADAGPAADRIEWLIDTPERLEQYRALAQGLGRTLRINIELDVGLHRGGQTPGPELGAMLKSIKDSPNLALGGFMGYEPHIPAIPSVLGWRESVKDAAWRIYSDALTQARDQFGASAVEGMTRNAAGSPTYRYYSDTKIANEVSAGSCLVKPSHFDSELLEPHQPASFIATPVIKAVDETRMPGLEFADGIKSMWDPNYRKTVFIYGGHWLADPVDPPGLDYNATFGRSSNQEMLNGGPALDVAPDEFVFFRPQQSEAVFLQFGDIAVYDGGEIVDFWPVFPASA